MILAPPSGFAALSVLSAGPAAITFEVHALAAANVPRVCKRLSSRAREDVEAARAMREEAALLDALQGRGAPKLIARGEDADGPWLVMERVALPTLRAQMIAGRTAPTWIAQAARCAFACLARVHDAEDAAGPLAVVHADLSPTNVMIADDAQQAMILDFGLAQWRDATAADTGTFRGTIAYAAPELARGESLDARADLFALAASLLHAVSGTTPRAEAHPAVVLALAAESPIDAWAIAAARALPEAVGRALVQCVAFAKEDRPRSAAHVEVSW